MLADITEQAEEGRGGLVERERDVATAGAWPVEAPDGRKSVSPVPLRRARLSLCL